MHYLSPNSLGLDVTTLLRVRNNETRRAKNALEVTAGSGGMADFIPDNTPDVKGMLGSHRTLTENDAHILNSTKTTSRAQGQIEFIQLCQNITLQLQSRLSDMRTDKGIQDTTFVNWCTEQLANIARTANTAMFDGTYPCASSTATIPPIDAAIILTPLASGAVATLDYAVGAFGPREARLTATTTCRDHFNATSAGTENLIRALRVCLTGNLAQSSDPAWAFANDLLVVSAVPNLAEDLRMVSELSHQAEESAQTLKDLAPIYGKNFKDYAFRPETEIIQRKCEEASKASQQTSSLFTNLKQTQDFFEKMELL